MKLTAKPVYPFCAGFKEITQLLKSSFPKKEQTSVFLLLLGALRKSTHFTAFYDADKFAGLLYTIENDRYYFILYFAVSPKMRSCGIGGEILNCAYSHAVNKIIVLNVEPLDSAADNYEQRKRQIAFYAKNGIFETGYGFSMEGVSYSVLASNLSVFDPDEYSKMLGGISFDTESNNQDIMKSLKRSRPISQIISKASSAVSTYLLLPKPRKTSKFARNISIL